MLAARRSVSDAHEISEVALCKMGFTMTNLQRAMSMCADKKLEGYRRDLMDDDVPHVSLVLTLAEFVEAIGGDRLATTQAVATEADLDALSTTPTLNG